MSWRVSLFFQVQRQEETAPSRLPGVLDWILGKFVHWKGGQALEQAAQGSGGITIPGSVVWGYSFSYEYGGAGLNVGLSDLRGLS